MSNGAKVDTRWEECLVRQIVTLPWYIHDGRVNFETLGLSVCLFQRGLPCDSDQTKRVGQRACFVTDRASVRHNRRHASAVSCPVRLSCSDAGPVSDGSEHGCQGSKDALFRWTIFCY